jgi:hypothetical protein
MESISSERKIKMTIIELQKILGETIEAVKDGSADTDQAKTIAALAKQMINSGDLILRADKFVKNGGKRIDKAVGEYGEETSV